MPISTAMPDVEVRNNSSTELDVETKREKLAMIPDQPQGTDSLLISHLNLRTLVGILGIFLPLLLIIRSYSGYTEWQDSISAYYHTNSRDYFVGILVAIGVFLVTYYGHHFWDWLVSTVAGIAAIGVALFPVGYEGIPESAGMNLWHYLWATLLFVLLTGMCWLFVKANGDKDEPHKIARDKVYAVCGSIMAVCLLVLLMKFTFAKYLPEWKPMVFWLESIAIVAFGVSWFVKGRSLYRLYMFGATTTNAIRHRLFAAKPVG